MYAVDAYLLDKFTTVSMHFIGLHKIDGLPEYVLHELSGKEKYISLVFVANK
jgi:hypothetical protein